MPTSTFRQIHQFNRSAYRPGASEDERRRIRDAKYELFRSLDEGIDAATHRRIEAEGFTRSEDGKYHNGSYVIHPHPDPVFRRIVDGSSFFEEFEGLRRSSTGGWRKWLPRDRDENVYLSLMNLGNHLENMGHIARRGWYFPDNPVTLAFYAVVVRTLAEFVDVLFGMPFALSAASVAGAAFAGALLGIPAALYFRSSDRNANPDFPMIRPWHQAQVLDHEVSFYRARKLEEWVHADTVPFKLPEHLESRQTIETALANPVFKENGQVFDPSYADGSYRHRPALPKRTVVPPRWTPQAG